MIRIHYQMVSVCRPATCLVAWTPIYQSNPLWIQKIWTHNACNFRSTYHCRNQCASQFLYPSRAMFAVEAPPAWKWSGWYTSLVWSSLRMKFIYPLMRDKECTSHGIIKKHHSIVAEQLLWDNGVIPFNTVIPQTGIHCNTQNLRNNNNRYDIFTYIDIIIIQLEMIMSWTRYAQFFMYATNPNNWMRNTQTYKTSDYHLDRGLCVTTFDQLLRPHGAS